MWLIVDVPVELPSYGALYPQLTTCVTQRRVPNFLSVDHAHLRRLKQTPL